MAIAAVPAYLGKDFSQASCGLRFGMFLPLWGVDSRSGELLWTTHDYNYRVTGHQREERRFSDTSRRGFHQQTVRQSTFPFQRHGPRLAGSFFSAAPEIIW